MLDDFEASGSVERAGIQIEFVEIAFDELKPLAAKGLAGVADGVGVRVNARDGCAALCHLVGEDARTGTDIEHLLTGFDLKGPVEQALLSGVPETLNGGAFGQGPVLVVPGNGDPVAGTTRLAHFEFQ